MVFAGVLCGWNDGEVVVVICCATVDRRGTRVANEMGDAVARLVMGLLRLRRLVTVFSFSCLVTATNCVAVC